MRGADRIDLSAIDADASAPGDGAFRLVGAAQFPAPGRIRTQTVGADTLVRINLEGSAGAGLLVFRRGVTSLSADGFVL